LRVGDDGPMKVLVTGHDGFIGTVLLPLLRAAGHEMVGLDTYLFHDCLWGSERDGEVEAIAKDVRDVVAADLEGFDAVIHLAAVSNDPVGNLDPACTHEINHRASVRLAQVAKQVGVPRFLFSSSCSLYGAAGDRFLDETAPFNPVTAYGHSKVLAERDIEALADDSFSPTFLRNATVYGASPRFRSDLVVNNLAALAYTTGEIKLMSDGTPWRPLIHVEDVARAFLGVLSAPRDLVHAQAFNIGSTAENYRVREIAEIVQEAIPGSAVVFASGAGPDRRTYKVSFEKFARSLPDSKPTRTVREGVRELRVFFERSSITAQDALGPRGQRIEHVRHLMALGRLEPSLRWKTADSRATGRNGRNRPSDR